jgi:hypothetical protein
VFSDSTATQDIWDDIGKFRFGPSAWRAVIMCNMAGAEAEIIAYGSHHLGDHSDQLSIAQLRDDHPDIADQHIEVLRRKTVGILLRHWPKVEHVAKTLLAARTLTGEQIDALIAEKTTPREREIARRIDIVRKPDRDEYLARKAYVERRQRRP